MSDWKRETGFSGALGVSMISETEKSPHQNHSVDKSPQGKTPQISPVEKTPQLIL